MNQNINRQHTPHSPVTVAVVQCALGGTREANIASTQRLLRQAVSEGAQVVLLPELFESPYFPQEEQEELFSLAAPTQNHPTIEAFAAMAKELSVVLPISFFEKDRAAYYNTIVMIDADGQQLGTYRKSHIPTGPGYQEKFYFKPGNSGFRVWETRYGNIGVGICWDQWFPEAARAMSLMGADLLLYPTAIGSEPAEDLDTRLPWRRVMQGHAVANTIPIAAANRIGKEKDIRFFGSSFVSDHRGTIVSELGESEEGVALYTFSPEQVRAARASFGLFRDRRPELYEVLTAP